MISRRRYVPVAVVVGLIAALWAAASGEAAKPTSPADFSASLEGAAPLEAFASIDPSTVPTGILYDRVIPLSRIEAFDGRAAAPPIGRREWRQLYFELRGAALEDPTWPALGEISQTAERVCGARAVPVAFMTFEYNRIRPGALEDGTLEIRDGRVERSGPGDPYETRTAHAVTALKDYTYRGGSVAFRFDRELCFSNALQAPASIEVDFDDGRGFREVRFGRDEIVRYASAGRKDVRTRSTFAGEEVLYGGFPFRVEALQTPDPDDTLSVTASIPYNGQFGTGEGYVYLAPGRSSIVNPVVVVEGFDLDDTMDWDELYALLNQENLLETLRADGFDAVVLNFTEATDYVQKNGFVVVELLQQVASMLDANHSIVMVGGSMGALCGRYALAWMESQMIDHRVRAYVSYDGPHGGANIPLGVQYWLDFFSDQSADAAFLLSRLDTPAARQLLVYHHTTPPGTTGESDPLRAGMIADFAAVGGYPAIPRKVAFANGSGAMQHQGFLPGDQIIDYEYNTLFIGIVGNVWALPDGVSDTIFDGSIRIIIPIDDLTVTVSGTAPYDNAPGGRRGSMAQMDSTQAPYGDIVALHTHHCFVPTVSALDLATADLFYNIAGDPDILTLTPFDAVYFPAANQEHMAIDAQAAAAMLDEIREGVTAIALDGPPPAIALGMPRPNPAPAASAIRVSTSGWGPVDVAVFDVAGRRVATLLRDENCPPGERIVNVETRGLSSGIYFIRMRANGSAVTRKLVVVR